MDHRRLKAKVWPVAMLFGMAGCDAPDPICVEYDWECLRAVDETRWQEGYEIGYFIGRVTGRCGEIEIKAERGGDLNIQLKSGLDDPWTGGFMVGSEAGGEVCNAELESRLRQGEGAITTRIDARLQTAIKNVYRSANEYADAYGGIDYGMNILYGPPVPEPDVMIVSAQGGGTDRIRQQTWPPQLSYLKSGYPFGQRLVRDFHDAGLSGVLETGTVATNIAFPQFKGAFGSWLKLDGSHEWLEMSLDWVRQMAQLMPPRVLLTYGSPAFRHLVRREKKGGRDRVDRDVWIGIPVVGCGNLMQGSTRVARKQAIALVRDSIS